MLLDLRREAFFRRSRRGQIVRTVKERHLREDVGCGYLHGVTVSSDQLERLVSEAPHQQLLVVDTNIVLHQVDLLEYKCPATSLVLVPQTVLQELRHLNLAAFKRILSLFKDESKSFIFFPNELFALTSTCRLSNETMNDANDRAIREVVVYFRDMLQGKGSVVLLTNDKENQVRYFPCTIFASPYYLSAVPLRRTSLP